MSKIIVRLTVYADEHGVFSANTPNELVGKVMFGGRVIAAKRVELNEIWLTLEIDIGLDRIINKAYNREPINKE